MSEVLRILRKFKNFTGTLIVCDDCYEGKSKSSLLRKHGVKKGFAQTDKSPKERICTNNVEIL